MIQPHRWNIFKKTEKENSPVKTGLPVKNRRSDPAAVHMDLLFADIPDLICDGIHNFLSFVNRLLKHRL